MTLLEIRLFGSIQVSFSRLPLTAFGAEKVRALFAFLTVESNRPHTRRRLAGLLWPDQPEERALHNLRQALSTLRKLLPDGESREPFILVTPDTVQFNPHSDHLLDVHAFHQDLDSAFRYHANHHPPGRPNLPRLLSALERYSGPFLDHLSLDDSSDFDEWATMQRENCNQRAIQALALLIDYHEQRHEFELARRAAERLVELAPWDETAHNQVIRLMAQTGQWSLAQARYQSLCRYLSEQMGLEPSLETNALFNQLRSAAAARLPLPPRCTAPSHNLHMPSTSFIGRTTEQAHLADLLADPTNRLITLLGGGGMGKSRLALQVAHTQIGIFPDGVWFIHTGDRALVPTIADALQFNFYGPDEPHTQLINYLNRKRALLVLDSFEHIQAETSVLAGLIDAAPGIVFLVTSRLRLDLHSEVVYQVQGLEIPPNTADFPSELEQFSAPALFLSRLRRLRRDIQLTSSDFTALLEICRMLEGMPLGLELAASAVWSRNLPEIAAEIRANLDFLTTCCPDLPARHRSLRAVFDHSWNLLSPDLRLAFARLAVFQSSFQKSAGAEVAQSSPNLFQALLDRSILRQNGDGRLEIPEPIHPYAMEKLAEVDLQPTQANARHAQHFIQLLESQNSALSDSQLQPALALLLPELDNIRQAWQWAAENSRLDLLERSLQPLHQLLYIRSAFQEAIQLLEYALHTCLAQDNSPLLAARLSTRLGIYYLRIGEQDKAYAALSHSLQVFQAAGQTEETILALSHLANVHRKRGHPSETQQLAEQLLQLSQSTSHLEGQRSAYYLLGQIDYNKGDLPQAAHAMKQSLDIARRLGSPLGILTSLNALGDYHCNQEHYPEAQRIFEECLQISRSLGSWFHMSMHLNNLGTVHHMVENYQEASRYYHESLVICQKTGDLEGEGIALCNLGEVATLLADYKTAQHYYAQALNIGRRIQNSWTIAVAHNNLGETLRRMNDFPHAWENFIQGLRIGWQSETLSQVMEALAGLGLILVDTGRKELGIQALSIVLNHPISEPKDRQLASDWLSAHPSAALSPPPLEFLVSQILENASTG